MNKTEKRAKAWLIWDMGYSPESIVFRSNKSPDFLLSGDIGVEIKRVLGRTLVIQEGQWLDLQKCKNCWIAIFDDVCVEPKAFIPVGGLNPPTTWGEYTIKVNPDGMTKWRLHLQILNELSGRGFTREQFRIEYLRERRKNPARLNPGSSLRGHRINTEGVNMKELKRMSKIRDEAAEKLLQIIKEADKADDNMRSYWANLNAGSES